MSSSSKSLSNFWRRKSNERRKEEGKQEKLRAEEKGDREEREKGSGHRRRYGAENSGDAILAKAASVYGDARKHVEKEQEEFNQILSSQVDLSNVFHFIVMNYYLLI